MNNDNDAIERIKANQNRIQGPNFTESENAVFNNPDMENKYEEEIEGASGETIGSGKTNKSGLIGLGFIKNAKKIKYYLIGGLIVIFILFIIALILLLTNESLKGSYLTDNVNDASPNNGSTSSAIATTTGTKKTNAIVSEFYKSSTIENSPFFSSLKEIANNYASYSLENGISLVEDEYDIAMIASTIHYNKFISDATYISGVINGYKTLSNMGIARSRGITSLPAYEMKSFYELADISLGTDLGIPDPELRGLAGNLVGSKVVSMCVSDNKGYLSNVGMFGTDDGKKVPNDVLDSTIIRYETLYYSGAPLYIYKNDGTQSLRWYTQQLKKRIDTLRTSGKFEEYYDISEFDENMDCGNNKLVHVVKKYMNYETYAKYLMNEYIPENYIECLDCNSKNKRDDVIEATIAIYNNRNQFASLYYDDEIDTINFSNGDSLTTTATEYQLPSDVKENFISPFNLNTKCTISSQFTANRSGYSHYAVDAYANDRNLVAVYDGVVKVVVKGIPNISSQWNGAACLDANGNMDSRSNGNYVVIEHKLGGQTYQSFYMHMETINVNPGDSVTKGQVIGTEGNTGCSTGYHLHYQLLSGSKRYDPTLLFAHCDGAQIISYGAKSLREYLYSVYPSYSYTNIDECVVSVFDEKSSTNYSSMDLETYTAGVVSHEMPATFNFEALKAQAIAARNEYITRTNYCRTGEIVPNSESFQTFWKINTAENKEDIIKVLAARETTGMLITYSHGLLATEYSSFPCEFVYTCSEPEIKDANGVVIDEYIPYYLVSSNEVTCRAKKGTRPDDVTRITKSSNQSNDGSEASNDAASKCSSKGYIYYCGSTSVPRQFRKQEDVISIVGDCSTISYDASPHSNSNSTYRTIPISVELIKEGSVSIGHGDNPEEDYSNFGGHNRGLSQILANIYAKEYGWNYIQLLHYFYDSKETSDYDLINIETPTIFVDSQTEYEANYSDCCTGIITIPITNSIKATVPVDFYVAGVLEYNFGSKASSSLLKALAISNRTWALNKTKWGEEILEPSNQYEYTYSNSKEIYDAVNATKEEVLVDSEGYITPTGYYDAPTNGSINGNNDEKTITYELGYLYSDETHKVMIPYDDNTESLYPIKGNIGIVYNVATYLTNNWYFIDQHEVLKFFYGEEYNVFSIRELSTVGAIKDENGNILGEPSNFNALSNVLNSSLEQYVSSNGKGTLQGVLAAAYWLYTHSNEIGDISLPYQLGGEYQKLGVNPNWGQVEDNPRLSDYAKTGLDCVGFIRWAFINGYYKYPSGYKGDLFRFDSMANYIDSNKLICGPKNESCHISLDEVNGKPVKSSPLAKYADRGMIQKGDILYHESGITYAGESTPQKYSHIGIVYDVNLTNRTIVVIHCSGGEPGIKYSVINIDTGLYESGSKHGFTNVLRLSEMEKRGY